MSYFVGSYFRGKHKAFMSPLVGPFETEDEAREHIRAAGIITAQIFRNSHCRDVSQFRWDMACLVDEIEGTIRLPADRPLRPKLSARMREVLQCHALGRPVPCYGQAQHGGTLGTYAALHRYGLMRGDKNEVTPFGHRVMASDRRAS